jgi:Zn-dependent protease with chaperone function
MASALMKLDLPSLWDVEYITHPSINERIRRLRRL